MEEERMKTGRLPAEQVADWDAGEFYHQLGIRYRTHDGNQVEKFLTDCARQLEGDGADRTMRCMVYNELGSFYRGTSRYQESMEAFRKSQEIILELKDRDTVEYATSINNMAGTCRLAGAHEQAVALFQEALEIHEKLGDRQSYAYASAHNNLSLAYQELGQLSLAAAHLERALPLIGNMPGRGHAVAVTYTNLSTLYHRMKEKDKAYQCIQKALGIFEGLDDAKNVHYAAAVNMLGELEYESGQYEKAAVSFKKAAEYTERFFGRNAEYETACQNLSRVCGKLGKEPAI